MTTDAEHAAALRDYMDDGWYPTEMRPVFERSIELLNATDTRFRLGALLAEHRGVAVDAATARSFIDDSVELIRATNHHSADVMDALADYQKLLKANPLYEAARRIAYPPNPKAES